MQIKLYSRPLCGWCQDAKVYLQEHNLSFQEVDVGRDRGAFAEMVKLSGQSLVPTIVINGKVLADFDVPQLKKFLEQFS
jgi:glutaredoxin